MLSDNICAALMWAETKGERFHVAKVLIPKEITGRILSIYLPTYILQKRDQTRTAATNSMSTRTVHVNCKKKCLNWFHVPLVASASCHI